jgi:hypothetical protein
MDTRIKKLWVKALESGQYEQCGARLYCASSERYCCLGVLTRLYLDEHPDDADTKEHLESQKYLNAAVVRWAGLPHTDPGVETGKSCVRLSKLNDNMCSTFKSIAKAIQENL